MDVPGWLQANGFERFVDLFDEHEIDGDVLGELTDADLAGLGIPLGPRKKLLRAIKSLASLPKHESAPEEAASTYQSSSQYAASQGSAERRQLTVMFVDLVGSTALSERLDPEDMRDVITSYQNTVAGVVTRFEGQVAKYMGDGVLCYFGWPKAHEDDAERSIRAGLAIMHALTKLKTHDGEALAARAGVATGLVVVGDLIGEGAAQEEAVVGETPNLAARVQGLAEPNQVVVAEATRHLLGDMFKLADLGGHELKGISGKTSAYVVTGERVAESRFEARSSGAISALIGRDHELALMLERWKQAKANEGQLLFLSGEAGIGKSRIARAMIEEVAIEPHTRISYQCSPYHTDSSLYPAIQQLTFASAILPGDDNETKLDKLEAILLGEKAPLLAALLGLETEARYGLLEMTPQQQRARTLEALADQLIRLSRQKPVLFLLEDAHWIDATTLELVDLCLDLIADAEILILVTARPTFEHKFGGHPIVTKLTLNRLGREQITSIVAKLTKGKSLPIELLDEIVAKTDGVPLFVEELTKSVLELGQLRETEEAFELTAPLSALAIPATLHDSLMARLDRLQPVKEVAQTAACIGREFDDQLLSDLLSMDEGSLHHALDQLVAAELVFRRGRTPNAMFIFKHALVRDAAYESLLKTRRRAIHEKLVRALETREGVAPEVLAHHAVQAGLPEKAVTYLRQAGDAAAAQPAYGEAITHVSSAIALIEEMSDRSAWYQSELELLLQLAQLLLTKIGYSSIEARQAFSRAKSLLDLTGNQELRLPVTYGLWIVHYIRAEHNDCLPMATRLVEEVDRQDADIPRMAAHRMLAATLLAQGKPQEAQRHLETSLEFYRPSKVAEYASRFAQEPSITVKAYLVLCLWTLGYADQADVHMAVAEEAARELNHVNTRCYAALHWSLFALCKRDDDLLRQSSQLMVDYSTEYGLALWKTYGEFGLSLLRCRADAPNAFELLQQTFVAYESSGCRLFWAFYKGEQAKEFLRVGKHGDALETIQEAVAFVESTGERWVEAELHRVTGEIHLLASRIDDAEASFLQAIEIAKQQKAKAWEVRAATSLARHWDNQGQEDRSRDLLAPLLDWFTEGFETADLKTAKTLFDGQA